jgi:signal transduction histidine kinase
MTDHRESPAKLLSLAVHEFRTPVAVVSGYLRMLLRHFGDNLSEQQKKLLQESEKSCGNLATLLTELSDLSQIEDGRLALRHEPVPLAVLLREVAEGVHEGHDRGVRFEVRDDGREAVVMGDRERLKSALTALVAATVRERAEAGVVVASCALRRGDRTEAIVALADGDDADRLASGDAGADTGRLDQYRGGMGFRLPIAARVIEAHGGRVSSPVVEKGRLTIVLSLPAAAEPERAA